MVMIMQKCVVLVEAWQLQCCGSPFKIGDTVEWSVVKYSGVPVESGTTVDFFYENHAPAHDEPILRLTATVEGIRAVFFRYGPCKSERNPNIDILAVIDEKSLQVEVADGRDEDVGEYRLGEYIVMLTNCTTASIE